MRPALSRSTVPGTHLVAAVLAVSAALALAVPTFGVETAAAARQRPGTTITVQAGNPKGPVRGHQLGVNHRFVGDGHGMWDPVADAPNDAVVRRLRRAGVSDIRYPGGIVANLFDWKKAIGDTRECQTSGQLRPEGYRAVARTAYGLDEHMRVVEQVGTDAIMVVPFITETPEDAADWVEYMNSPADGSNPNGGVDWAQLRADNGHPAPYGVRYWEIGNEQRVGRQRYWMSADRDTAMAQYANGDTVPIRDEMLSRGCAHPFAGSLSTGEPNQVFHMLYPPVAPGSVTVEVVGTPGIQWQEVASLNDVTGDVPAYVVNEADATVSFGDGNHGAVLPKGVRVRASYTSVHQGVFSFIRRMKEVDPTINACVTWGLEPFIRIAGGRDYDCFTVHSYTNFTAEKTYRWRTAVEGHDRSMLGANSERAFVKSIKRRLPPGVSLALTEFGSIHGRTSVYPEWAASMTHATYMASMWVNWMNMGFPLAVGNAVLGSTNRGLLGPAPHFTMSAEALTREAIKPLYTAGNRRVGVDVTGNPVRVPDLKNAGHYSALSVAAVKSPGRELRLLVVNRLPSQRVRARLNLRGFTSRGVAYLSRVNGSSFRSWNTAKTTEVHLRTYRHRIGRDAFTEVFPAHSVTVIRIPARG